MEWKMHEYILRVCREWKMQEIEHEHHGTHMDWNMHDIEHIGTRIYTGMEHAWNRTCTGMREKYYGLMPAI